jgi:hypothetical protein
MISLEDHNKEDYNMEDYNMEDHKEDYIMYYR